MDSIEGLSPDFRVPVLNGRWSEIRAVEPDDYSFIYSLANSPEHLVRWRYRGSTPSPETLLSGIWQDCLVQFIVQEKDTKRRIGLVSAIRSDFRNGYAYLVALNSNLHAISPAGPEGFALMVKYLFVNFPFRKLYIETFDFNLYQFRQAVGRLFVEEGRLCSHEYYDGHYWDLITLALYRDAAEQYIATILGEGSE